MKKISLLSFLLALVILPGCREKRKDTYVKPARKTTDRYLETNMYAADENEIEDQDAMVDLDNDDLDADIDLDMDEIDALLKEYTDEDDADEYSAELYDEDANESQVFNWVDEQADDELRKLYFAFNHYGIRADQKDALLYDIEQVKQLVADAGNSLPTIVIEGHACQEGSPSYNIGLSEKRAKSVADLFVEAGVDKELIKIIGRGQECPVVLDGKVINGSREDRAPNRRVEVRVIYT